MIDPITLSVPELAERWGVTTRQILEHALALRLPVLFPFDGLAFDQADRWLMGHGDADEQRELERKREWVASSEALLRRNAAGLTDEFDRLGRDDVIALRRQITEAEKRIEVLTELLETRERERRKREYRGHMRALPGTLWEIMQHGETAFPHLALHPLSQVIIAEHAENQHWDGRIMTLEPDLVGRWTHKLGAADLLVPMTSIKALETASTLPSSENQPLPKERRQEQAVIAALRQLGYNPAALPPRTPGAEWVKAQAWRALASRTDLFTKGTFNKTWDRLRASGDIAEQA